MQPLQPAPLAAAVDRSRNILMIAMGAALIVLLIAVVTLARPRPPIMTSASTQSPPAPPITSAASTTVPGAPPLIAAPSSPGGGAPPITSAASTPTGALPADVDAYLKFMQGIEARRIALNSDTESADSMLTVAHQMQGGANSPLSDSTPDNSGSSVPDPDASTTDSSGSNMPGSGGSQGGVATLSKGFGDYTTKWQTLIRDFDSVPPPDSCKDLAAQYHKFLSEYAAVISKLQVALLNGDISSAMQMQTAQGTIDADGAQADADLADLCNRYNAPKPFTIAPEGTSPSLLTE